MLRQTQRGIEPARRRARRAARTRSLERLESRLAFSGLQWSFDDGPWSNIIQETEGAGPDLTVVSSSPATAWALGTADHSADIEYALRTSPASSANGLLTEFDEVESLAFWFRPDQSTGTGSPAAVILELPSASGPADVFALGEWSSAFQGESFSLIDQNTDGWRGTAIAGVDFSSEMWTHIAITWNSAAEHYDFYLNGEAMPVVPNSKGHAGKILVPTGVRIGRRSSVADPLPFSGLTDDLRISNGLLTAAQIHSLSAGQVTFAEVSTAAAGPRDSALLIALAADSLVPATADYEVVRFPVNGALVTGDSSRYLTYHPSPEFTGEDFFTYRTFDGVNYGEERAVAIRVTPDNEPTLSYFVPGRGTINTATGVRPTRSSQGEPFPYDVIVNQQYGDVVERLDSQGNVVWRVANSGRYSSVDIHGSEVIIPNANRIRFLDLTTGDLFRDWEFDETWMIEFVNQVDADRFLVYRTDMNFRRQLELWSRAAGLLWTSPEATAYARWADLSGNIVAVADTFNHRVLGIDFTSNSVVFEVEAYFPNDVRFVGEHEILITEEHADRIWTYDWQTGGKQLVFAAPGERGNLDLPFSQVVEISESTELRIDPQSDTSKSRSSVDFSGPMTVYAPNGAVRSPDGTYYIADTDNHRVIRVSADGELLGEITGFNNPTKLAVVALESSEPPVSILPESHETTVQFDYSITDLAGEPLHALTVGDEFLLVVTVEDVRPEPTGVFSAYLDVEYSSALADVTGEPLFGDSYVHSREGNTTGVGLLDDIGAYSELEPLGGGPHKLFSLPMRASAAGELIFSGASADLAALHDILVYGLEASLPAESIQFGSATVTIYGPASLSNDAFTVREDAGETALEVLANDQIEYPATITHVTNPMYGTAGVSPDGNKILYRPSSNFFGNDEFTYRVRDALGRISTALVTLQIDPSNDPPSALSDDFTVFEIAGRTLLPVLANDSATPDENEQLFVAFVSQPSDGGRVQLIDGQVWFTPADGFYGETSFNYVVRDGRGGSAMSEAVVHIHKQWNNFGNQYDVNRDGIVSPLDALLVINFLNRFGAAELPAIPDDDRSGASLVDVNNDGVAAPSDVLQIINELERQASDRRESGAEGESQVIDAALMDWISEQPYRHEFGRDFHLRKEAANEPRYAIAMPAGTVWHPFSPARRRSQRSLPGIHPLGLLPDAGLPAD